MSSDAAKENASVIDSSVTEWKNERGNMDEPDCPSFSANEDICRSRAEEHTISCQQIGISSSNGEGKVYGIRYFIIKSLNHENIQLSLNKGIWATQVMNEPILDEAFHNSSKVILIFSVNMSGCFQGYAQMISSVGWRRDQVWSQGNGGRNPWGRSFKVKWLRLYDLPFQRTLHLKNPWNHFKPVKISRDCQELPPDVGEALCELLDGQDALDVNLKMYSPFPEFEIVFQLLLFGNIKSLLLIKYELLMLELRVQMIFSLYNSYGSFRDRFARNDVSFKRPYVEPSVHHGDEDSLLQHMGSMLYPSLLYQVEASRRLHQRIFVAEESAIASKSKQSRHSILHVDPDEGSQFNPWGLSTERSPLASNLTEDDILDMTYEDYLEAHSRGSKKSDHTVSGPSQSTQKSLVSEENCDDLLQSGCSSKKRRSR